MVLLFLVLLLKYEVPLPYSVLKNHIALYYPEIR